MSGFGDEQLNNMAQSLEQIEDYMGRITKALESLVKVQELQFYPEKEAINRQM